MHSEQTDKINAALSKAQGSFEPLIQNQTVKYGATNFAFADLPGTLENVQKPLAENGLAIVQTTQMGEGSFFLETLLVHSSGQFYRAVYPLPLNAKPQDMGSAITYARRYTLCAILGRAGEQDDDGQRAGDTKASKAMPQKGGVNQGRATSPSDPPLKAEPQTRGGAPQPDEIVSFSADPNKPRMIPVPMPEEGQTMKQVWQKWMHDFESATNDAADAEEVNNIIKDNNGPLGGLESASKAGYAHVVKLTGERRNALEQTVLGAG